MARSKHRMGLLTAVLLLAALVFAAQLTATAASRTERSRARDRSSLVARGFRQQLHGLGRQRDRGAAALRIIRAAAIESFGSTSLLRSFSEHEDQGFRVLLRGGDLNGDSKADALDVTDATLRGVKGTDGSTLWTHTYQGWGFPVSFGPLDGVAGDDLTVMELATTAAGPAHDVTTRLLGLSGVTGNTLWTRTSEEVWMYADAGAGYEGVGYADVDFVLPMGSADLNGDGALDLLLGQYEEAWAGGDIEEGSAVVGQFLALSGRDGSPLTTFPAPGNDPSYPDAVVVPDLTGDGTADVAVVSTASAAGQGRAIVAAYSGKGGPPIWQQALQLPYQPYLSGLDVSGDQRAEVILEVDDEATEVRALAGTSGAELWRRSLGDYGFAVPAGDANADGRKDLLAVTFGEAFWFGATPVGTQRANVLGVPPLPGHDSEDPYCSYGYGCEPCPPEDCPPAHAMLISGSSGAVLWDQAATQEQSVEPAGDATGDGIPDILVNGPDPSGVYDIEAKILSGKTGVTAWTKRADAASFMMPLGEADLNADGYDDLALVDWGYPSDRYIAISGKTGGNLWPAMRSPGGYLWLLTTAALGTNGDDLLESIEKETTFETAARNGNDGVQLWKRT